MKRVSAILFLCIYSLSTSGITLKQFYCCGKLTSVSISVSLADDKKVNCNKGDEKEGCCETKYQIIKGNDTHDAVKCSVAQMNFPGESILPITASSFLLINYRELTIINGSHAPPAISSVPIRIMNCVFRI